MFKRVCLCVSTIFIVSSLNKVMASLVRLLARIDCPNNTHTHTQTKDGYQFVCVGVCESRVRHFSFVHWLINKSLSDGETFDRFFFCFSFVFACMCDFASRLYASICREESFAWQLMGSIHSNLVSFEIKKINKK